jgi:uncharacterized protein YneF (UPF0154 family)
MLLLLVVILIIALMAERIQGYIISRRMKQKIMLMPECRLLQEEVKRISHKHKKQASVVIDTDGYTGTMGIITAPQGRIFARKQLQLRYIFVIDKENRSVKSVAPFSENIPLT